MQGIQDRLRTRFSWGLMVDILPPEFETRVAILRRKAEEDAIEVPDEVAELVADHVTGSVRELEGTLGRLAAQARIEKISIDVDLARRVLGALLPAGPAVACTIEDVQKAVCGLFNVHLSDLRGPSRRRAITLPRHVAMYLARESLRQSFPAIAEQFGNRDHTTVMSACRQIGQRLQTDRASTTSFRTFAGSSGSTPDDRRSARCAASRVPCWVRSHGVDPGSMRCRALRVLWIDRGQFVEAGWCSPWGFRARLRAFSTGGGVRPQSLRSVVRGSSGSFPRALRHFPKSSQRREIQKKEEG